MSGLAAPGRRDLALDVRDLGIRYNLNFTKRTTLKGSLGTMLRRSREATTHFWALRHLSFSIEHGESLGVIGPNGAGKSTLLLALAGILAPSEGAVDVRGKVSTLLTLGAGFEPELSGRDNVDLVGAFLGVGRKEMAELAPSIVDFAELGAFIDAPVKTYSLGMKARLGFSIATAVQPDILLLDEVLGTGDQVFRARSQQRIRELMVNARAIVLVTHDLTYITEFCNRGMLLEQGQIVFQGDPAETVELYRERAADRKLLAASETRRFSEEPAR
ncbi:MAG: ABC transporter ATP-binding protein [Chloroflexi bacterium]|nr:ABC transporter ATP-binding protein [Chloroflexota bacterium]